MGIVKCFVCGSDCSPWYNWTSSRGFPLDKLYVKMNVESKLERKNLVQGREICFLCHDELMKRNE